MYFNNQIKWKYKGIKILCICFLVLVSKYSIVFMQVMRLHYITHGVMINQSINAPEKFLN